MKDPSDDLVTRLFEALRSSSELSDALGGTKIFDKLPESVAYPYVVIGRTSTADWSTATEEGVAITFFIHSWSQAARRGETAELQQKIDTIISDGLPDLRDHELIQIRRQIAEIQRDYGRDLVHGLMRYRAVLEPKPI